MKYMVTGGAGFIGSNLIDILLREGKEVICIDNFDNFYNKEIKLKNLECAHNFKNFKLLRGDIRDKQFLEKCFKENDIGLIFHLAARAGVRPSIISPEVYHNNNIVGTLNILELMYKSGIKKLVFASSSSVYGDNSKTPFSEDSRTDFPISPYAVTKKTCELLAYNYHILYELDIYCLRLFTVYGPRQRPDLAINKFAHSILRENEITLYGDGSMERDYTYIEDIIGGFINAAQSVKGYNIFNLGNSTPVSLNCLIEYLENIIGKKARIKYLPKPPGDVDKTFADISKARNMINYNPSTTITDGLKKYCEWIK